MDRQFPIGFWNYTPVGWYGPETVQDWKDCGMTVAISPRFHPDQCRKEDLLKILDESYRLGIRVIVSDDRTYWHGAAQDPEAYRQRVREAYADFGRHPAVFGFHVGDEPTFQAIDEAILAYRIHLEVAPELTPFINFLPCPADLDTKWALYAENFDSFADRFASAAGLKLLCYDHYTQMLPEESGIESYFLDLRQYMEAAKRLQLPLWTTLLSVGHYRYRCPTEDDLRWQLNTAVASGCKGILWFYFYLNGAPINYRVPPIDELGEKTETYRWLSRTLRIFAKKFGPTMAGLDHLSTYHFVKSYGGYPIFRHNTDPYVYSVSSEHGLPGMLSFFRGQEGDLYIAMVNTSQKESGVFKVLFQPQVSQVFHLVWDGTEKDVSTCGQDAFYAVQDGKILSGTWLAPGQMELFRIRC